MPGGGRITIETANAYLDEAYVAQFGDVPAGQYVMLSVADTGGGIDPAVHANTSSSPSTRPRRSARAPGLGLAMVHGFVKQSGGHIRIYSEIGHGTTVKHVFAAIAGNRRGVRSSGSERTGIYDGDVGARDGETILLVEDNEGVRAYTKTALEELGYRVHRSAATPWRRYGALERAPRVDLLFTDVVLPGGMSGRGLADKVAQERPGLPILFTTGSTRNAIIHHGRLDPDVNLLSKPYTQQDLARKIRQLLGAPARP